MNNLPSDHDRLIRIDERTESIKNDLMEGKKHFTKIDTRITVLERFKSRVFGGLAVVGALIGWLKYGGH